MNLKNKNIVNLFNPNEINNSSLAIFMYSFLPAAFVAKHLESTLVYILLTFIFLFITYLVNKLINITVKDDLRNIIIPMTTIGIATLVAMISKAFFITFSKDYLVYVYLLSVSALPYMLAQDNEDKSFGKGLVNTIQTFIGFSSVMIIIAIVREFFGTGGIYFGTYTKISFSFNVLKDYAFTVLQNPLGSLIILGFLMALINRKGVQS